MHCAQRPAHVLPDQRRLAITERPLLAHQCRQRFAVHEIRPESDPPLVAVDTINRKDVRVANRGERARLAQNFLERRLGLRRSRHQEFQPDFPLQIRIPGAVDFAEAPATYQLTQLEASPPPGTVRDLRTAPGACGRIG